MKYNEVSVSFDKQEVKHVEGIDKQLKWLLWNWNSSEVSTDTPPDRQWWEFWKTDGSNKKGPLVVGRYLLEALDDFIKIIIYEGNNPLDYKATIINSISALYDTVINDAKIPWWIKPFKGSLKKIIINVLASLLIDYIVAKHKEYAGG